MPAVVQLRPQLEPVDKRLQDGGDVVANVDRENECLGKEARLGPRRRQPHSLGRLGESDLGLETLGEQYFVPRGERRLPHGQMSRLLLRDLERALVRRRERSRHFLERLERALAELALGLWSKDDENRCRLIGSRGLGERVLDDSLAEVVEVVLLGQGASGEDLGRELLDLFDPIGLFDAGERLCQLLQLGRRLKDEVLFKDVERGLADRPAKAATEERRPARWANRQLGEASWRRGRREPSSVLVPLVKVTETTKGGRQAGVSASHGASKDG